jgi:hypothetical protein
MLWFCRSCNWAAKITFYVVNPNLGSFGTMYTCHCGYSGRMSHVDAPIEITEEEADLYWFELQNDKEFLPHRLAKADE